MLISAKAKHKYSSTYNSPYCKEAE